MTTEAPRNQPGTGNKSGPLGTAKTEQNPWSRKVNRKVTISRHDLIHLQLTALNPLSLLITRLPAVPGLLRHLHPRILLLQNVFPKGRGQPR